MGYHCLTFHKILVRNKQNYKIVVATCSIFPLDVICVANKGEPEHFFCDSRLTSSWSGHYSITKDILSKSLLD